MFISITLSCCRIPLVTIPTSLHLIFLQTLVDKQLDALNIIALLSLWNTTNTPLYALLLIFLDVSDSGGVFLRQWYLGSCRPPPPPPQAPCKSALNIDPDLVSSSISHRWGLTTWTESTQPWRSPCHIFLWLVPCLLWWLISVPQTVNIPSRLWHPSGAGQRPSGTPAPLVSSLSAPRLIKMFDGRCIFNIKATQSIPSAILGLPLEVGCEMYGDKYESRS